MKSTELQSSIQNSIYVNQWQVEKSDILAEWGKTNLPSAGQEHWVLTPASLSAFCHRCKLNSTDFSKGIWEALWFSAAGVHN